MSALIEDHVKGVELQAFAGELIGAGFTVKVPQPRLDVHGKPIPVTWLLYEKNGCAGLVQQELDGYSHSMPVHPTRENGSAILITRPDWRLWVSDAERTARPMNGGPWVAGVFKNDATEKRWEKYIPLSRTLQEA